MVTDWAGAAFEAVMDRVSSTYAAVGTRFPLYADSTSGEWTTTSRGSWTGGFWAGLLWLRALASGRHEDRSAAAETTQRLAGWVTSDTSTRGLILWYGTALAAGRGGDASASALREGAARQCRTDFDQGLGVLPWGSAFGGPRLLARVDGIPGLVPLLATDMDPRSPEIAREHLATHLTLWRTTPIGTPAWVWSEGTWLPSPRPQRGWSRGRAWLLLALADACRYLSSEFLVDACTLLGADQPLVPRAENRPDAPTDTSAAVIEAVALLKLAAIQPLTAQSKAMQLRAIEITRRLITDFLSGPGTQQPGGRLGGGCYDFGRGLATSHELIWGNFFFASALAMQIGLVAPFDT
jgi:unsaturated chondroitin disaccharide hydrolase